MSKYNYAEVTTQYEINSLHPVTGDGFHFQDISPRQLSMYKEALDIMYKHRDMLCTRTINSIIEWLIGDMHADPH